MTEEIYSGESQAIVLRFRDRPGNDVEMTGNRVDVVLADDKGRIVFEFSTEAEGAHKVLVEGSYLICRFTPAELSTLQGLYMAEIRVEESVWEYVTRAGTGGNSQVVIEPDDNPVIEKVKIDSVVRIAQVPGLRVLDSVTGRKFL